MCGEGRERERERKRERTVPTVENALLGSKRGCFAWLLCIQRPAKDVWIVSTFSQASTLRTSSPRPLCVFGTMRQAAEHVNRYLKFDKGVLESESASESFNGASPAQLLRNAHATVVKALDSKFDEVAEAGQDNQVNEYFTLFPLVGRSEEGMQKFGRYAASQIAREADSHLKKKIGGEDIKFPSLLGKLLDNTVKILREKKKVMRKHYGQGQSLRLIKILQEMCDSHSTKVLEHFEQEVKLEAMAANNADIGGEMAELEPVLNEVQQMILRAELYLQYLRKTITNELAFIRGVDEAGQADQQIGPLPDMQTFGFSMLNGDLTVKTQQLIASYVTLEERGLKQNITKAIDLDTIHQTGTTAQTSSLVDDAFFVISRSARRAMSTMSTNCFCAMLNQICALLETEYLGLFKAKIQSSLGSGSLADFADRGFSFVRAAATQGSSTKEGKTGNIMITLNNLEESRELTVRLYKDLESRVKDMYKHATESDAGKISSCLGGFTTSANHLEALLKDAVTQICSSTLARDLKPQADAMIASRYIFSEEDFSSQDTGSQVITNYIAKIRDVLEKYEAELLPPNFDVLLATLAEDIAGQLEDAVLKTQFNKLGGMQLETDLRVVTKYLSSLTQWSCREKFTRLTQMVRAVLTIWRLCLLQSARAQCWLGALGFHAAKECVAHQHSLCRRGRSWLWW